MTFEKLKKLVLNYNSKADVKLLERAYHVATIAHEGQVRLSGEPFIIHPLWVAYILAELKLDTDTIIAGLLHDLFEDTQFPVNRIKEEFGEEVFSLIEGVSKIKRLTHPHKSIERDENLRKMLLAMGKDVRVILIKLADRLHNMRTIKFLPDEDKKLAVAQETQEIYAKLANRLGIGKLRWELEDLSFECLNQEAYQDIAKKLTEKREDREAYLRKIKKELTSKFKEVKIKASIEGRAKHFYSIYCKMKSQNKPFDGIYDILGIRIITNDKKDCYGVLGIVHSLWKPVPGRFKDYIADPKSNDYRSIHTTVIGTDGKPLEIQIRTKEMHIVAEEGIAAHWHYKEDGGKTKFDSKLNEKLMWARKFVEGYQDLTDAKDFMEHFKLDLFSDEVFVFTPKGQVKKLPLGSTPIDFAYAVHSDIGDHCFGAKVGGKIVPLNYKLKSGDIVEIITSAKVKPHRDWLNTVRTSKARSRIRQFIKSELEKKEKPTHEETKTKLPPLTPPKIHKSSLAQVKITGVNGLEVSFSKCCNPIPGDKIIGYITRGHGVSIHRAVCHNIQSKSFDSAHMIDVAWQVEESGSYETGIYARALTRKNLLNDMLTVMAATHSSINATWTEAESNGTTKYGFNILINDKTHLQNIIKQLKQVQGVIEVYRG
ncbi:MAG: bifunctional (p)ppGpp synthetase/guanosine-3',5'-bis(diphosphate) 3'-pyrophosphohydrolase [bacterium]